MKKNLIDSIIENVKTIFYALIIATIIRSLFFQPFYIPSSSMEPTLLIGDRIFVAKYTYGYSKHSFPFSPPLFKKRLLEHSATRLQDGLHVASTAPASRRRAWRPRRP